MKSLQRKATLAPWKPIHASSTENYIYISTSLIQLKIIISYIFDWLQCYIHIFFLKILNKLIFILFWWGKKMNISFKKGRWILIQLFTNLTFWYNTNEKQSTRFHPSPIGADRSLYCLSKCPRTFPSTCFANKTKFWLHWHSFVGSTALR